MTVVARAPGRVNLIGDHTDYTGGLVLPMAVDRWTEVRGRAVDEPHVRLRSDHDPEVAVVSLDVADPGAVTPPWARYVAGVVAELRPARGFTGTVASSVPVGAGLSSSAALEVAVALALGADSTDVVALARRCQAAEHRATGVPCGVMDQLVALAAVEGHALLVDCHTLARLPVPVPAAAEVVVVHSGEARALAASAYADRVAECAAAEARIGPLHSAAPGDEAPIADPVLRRRARHVLTENARVRAFAAALAVGDLPEAGQLMVASHRSLRDDFEVSTPALDRLVERLGATPGVHGARLTGAGFGGCVVALTEPGALQEGWVVRPVGGAVRS